jgi:hypothetical protein
LPQDYDFYRAIANKAQMFEEWNIKTIDKLPRGQGFYNTATFAQDFEAFLTKTHIPETLTIESYEQIRERKEAETMKRYFTAAELTQGINYMMYIQRFYQVYAGLL